MHTPPKSREREPYKLEGEIAEVVEGLQQFKPESVFLYGSRARTDYLPTSDHEVGVLFRKASYVGRGELSQAVGRTGFSIYPFRYEDFVQYNPDTPFQKTIYMRELIEGGRTLSGADVVEQMKPPEIKALDLLQDIRFSLGRALDAVISNRNGDKVSAGLGFSKSCLFGVRCLEIADLQQFPLTYDDIYRLSSQVVLPEYQPVVEAAYKSRQEHTPIQPDQLFRNISLLNQVVEPRLVLEFENEGNKVVLP